ncbi:MAG: 16S rRNA (cytosine(1402)-N(4))-methyltransferase RsmH [Gammaproteobacteria bacterium]|nr:16S rRNA (cytosine(1402)-N(4))-methyltransferase RsmH [Gammaproteobacteria bacterium]
MTDLAVAGHYPVMLNEAIEGLAIKADGTYIDVTYGRGGHSQAILSQLGSAGRLLAFDRDIAAVADARERMADESRFEIIHSVFSNLADVVGQHGLLGKVDGLLCDFGVSSPQIDSAERGFSFRADGPLDMRMDQSQGQSVAQWLQDAQESEIAQVLREFGEERYARRIARAIIARRKEAPLATTAELRQLVVTASPKQERHKDPATRSFQALRIQVNDELGEIKRLLEQALSVLAPAGRLVVISFHSLEDRIVKCLMRQHSSQVDDLPHDIPFAAPAKPNQLKLVAKARSASQRELDENPRSRSAMLRIAERCPC